MIDDNRSIHDDFRKILGASPAKNDSLAGTEAVLFGAVPADANQLSFEVHSAYHGQEGLALVRQAVENGRPYAMAFVDVRMPPGWDGVETAAHVWEVCPDLQIVICSAYSDYSWNEMAARLRNAHQLVILKKPFDAIEVLQLADALTEKWQLHQQARLKVDQLENLVQERTAVLRETNQRLEREVLERKRSEARIQEQAVLLDMAQDAIYVRDLGGGIRFWNTGAERLYGWSAQEAAGISLERLFPEDAGKAGAEAGRIVLEKGEWRGELHQKAKDGREVIADSRWTLVRDGAGNPRSVLVINTDQTEKKKLETQFLRAQRMESIGTLASGMAHDLNNVLAPILMSASMLRWPLSVAEREAIITGIETSVRRAAEIIQQVLTFGRGVNGERAPVNPSELMEEIGKIIGQTFPKNISIVMEGEGPKLWPIIGDKTQIHQVLLNLCINARDAMPEGGVLSLGARNVTLGQERAALDATAPAGPYVLLQITDTGCGIAPSDRDRVFDPFFTTKDVGKGTGLGLSTVLGIVKSHHGFVAIDSELKKGASFRVYLPASTEPAATTMAAPSRALPRGHGETILLVDDEKEIVLATGRMLEQSGYKVIPAGNGREALELFRRHDGVDLVLTDLMMEGMDGMALIHALREIDAAVRVIASTGLGVKLRPADLRSLPANSLLSKPYGAETLLTSLDRALKGARKRAGRELVSAKV